MNDPITTGEKGPTMFERIMAWGSIFVLIGATVAACWIADTVLGLLALSLFAAATAWCAVTGNLVQK